MLYSIAANDSDHKTGVIVVEKMKYIPGTSIPFSEDPWQMSQEEIAYWLEGEDSYLQACLMSGQTAFQAAYWLRVAG